MPYATSLCPPGSLAAWVSPTSGPGQAWPAALLDKDGQADAQDRTLSSLARGTATLIVHARFSANADAGRNFAPLDATMNRDAQATSWSQSREHARIAGPEMVSPASGGRQDRRGGQD